MGRRACTFSGHRHGFIATVPILDVPCSFSLLRHPSKCERSGQTILNSPSVFPSPNYFPFQRLPGLPQQPWLLSVTATVPILSCGLAVRHCLPGLRSSLGALAESWLPCLCQLREAALKSLAGGLLPPSSETAPMARVHLHPIALTHCHISFLTLLFCQPLLL